MYDDEKYGERQAIIRLGLVVLAFIAVGVICFNIDTSEESTEGETEASRRRVERYEAERRQQGLHCLESEWREPRAGEEPTNTVLGFGMIEYVPLIEAIETQVKQNLPEPESMVIHDLRITPVDENGQHRTLLDFGARNEFGGMSRFHLVALVDSESCMPLDFLGIEEIA